MAYEVKMAASVLSAYLDDCTIDAPPPSESGVVQFHIYQGGLKGEALSRFIREHKKRLAEELGTDPPEIEYAVAGVAQINWLVGDCTVEQILRKLADLFDSTEFTKAVQKSQEGQNG